MAKRRGNRKQPKLPPKKEPAKKPKIVAPPDDSPEDGHIHFRFRLFDSEFKTTENTGEDCFYEIGQKLRALAVQGWSGIAQRKDLHHRVGFDSLAKEANSRIRELKLDDEDGLFSLRLEGIKRVYGITRGSTFYVIWWDPKHRVCPSKKKHT